MLRMQTIFNCCHGVFDTQAAKWICASHPSEGGPRVDEEVIGADDAFARGGFLSAGAGSDDKFVARPSRPSAPLPLGGQPGHEDDKETAKQRLQRLIRDFAHDAVGPGLNVEAHSQSLHGEPWAAGGGPVEATLRMDRRLSRIELWPPSTYEAMLPGTAPMLHVPLQQVTSIAKGANPEPGEAIGHPIAHRVEHLSAPADSCMLTVARRAAPDLRLAFDTPIARDRAYTCLRIFQMSVDHSAENWGRSEPESPAGP